MNFKKNLIKYYKQLCHMGFLLVVIVAVGAILMFDSFLCSTAGAAGFSKKKLVGVHALKNNSKKQRSRPGVKTDGRYGSRLARTQVNGKSSAGAQARKQGVDMRLDGVGTLTNAKALEDKALQLQNKWAWTFHTSVDALNQIFIAGQDDDGQTGNNVVLNGNGTIFASNADQSNKPGSGYMACKLGSGNVACIFEKYAVPHFSQLLFSWNAWRPKKGNFSFFGQVRNAITKQWGSWHHMIDWGADMQHSYFSQADGFTAYHHVRLEVDRKQLADAFRIRAVARDGAQLVDLKRMTASIANYTLFKEESSKVCASLPSVRVAHIPKFSQRTLAHPDNDRMCSPTSCSMVTQFLCAKEVDPLTFARASFDKGLGAYGSWPFNMAHAFEVCNGNTFFYVSRLNSFSALHAQLQRGMPVIVSIRGPIEGGHTAYANGHLLVVVGWDAKNGEVLCHDPAFPELSQVDARYKINHFLSAWEASRRLVYWAERV